jgi:hypothetical protein
MEKGDVDVDRSQKWRDNVNYAALIAASIGALIAFACWNVLLPLAISL